MTGSITPPTWKVEIVVPAAVGDTIAQVLEDYTGAVSLFPAPAGGAMLVSGYAASEPDEPALRAALDAASRDAGIAAPPVDIVWLPAMDWAAANRESFAPLCVGGVWIRDSYHEEPAPQGAIPLVVDAATAFGTGHHATTQGCLIAVDHFVRRPGLLPLGPVLDMGCGTGILGMAAAKRLRRRVMATDIDPVAVEMARFNVKRNGLGASIQAICSRGYNTHVIRQGGPYALILANILARPLIRMAPDCASHLQPGGYVILSGLLTTQERAVQAAHRQQGLTPVARYRIDDWSTLVMQRPI